MQLTATLTLTDEKKHSVRYDSDEDSPVLRSAYIKKDALPRPFPPVVVITITAPGGEA